VQGGGDGVEVGSGGGVAHLGIEYTNAFGGRGSPHRGRGWERRVASRVGLEGSRAGWANPHAAVTGEQIRMRRARSVVFTDFELEYCAPRGWGRLATLNPRGTLQNSPVGYQVDDEAG